MHPSFVDFAIVAAEPGQTGLRLRPLEDLFELSLTAGADQPGPVKVLLSAEALAALGRYLGLYPDLALARGGHFRARAEEDGSALASFAPDGKLRLAIGGAQPGQAISLSAAQAATLAKVFTLASGLPETTLA